jgi:hypothetical protein
VKRRCSVGLTAEAHDALHKLSRATGEPAYQIVSRLVLGHVDDTLIALARAVEAKREELERNLADVSALIIYSPPEAAAKGGES